MNEVNILGVPITDEPEEVILEYINSSLDDGKIFVATPNPEMLVLASRDQDFKKILQSADINIADGVGLKVGAKILGKKLKNRITGTDLMFRICKLAEMGKDRVYFLGGGLDVARLAVENIKEQLPKLIVAGVEYGGKMDRWDNRVILEHINAVKPDILFVALGHGKQEKWIARNFKKLESVKVAMGVGGAFDFFAGTARRAPKFMRIIGLEWLWRLFREPKRIGRIITAVIIFPLICLKSRIYTRI